MTLTEQLKHIYATGDDMTVLKMLKGLIDAVEGYEGRTATSDQVEHLTNKVGELDEWLGHVADDVDILNEHVGHLDRSAYQNVVHLVVGNDPSYDVFLTICGNKIENMDDLIAAMPKGYVFPATGIYVNDENVYGIICTVSRTESGGGLYSNLTVHYNIPTNMQSPMPSVSALMKDTRGVTNPDVKIYGVFSTPFYRS